ncbi:MAG: hypothetical protein DMH00_11115 [Acidobacteria bacterium]|nr:MAG: hypothetical protein DMH00_11115 [Acidobacteriota bacterium]
MSESKVRLVESGKSPVLEPGLEELIRQGKQTGRLRASTKLDDAAREADAFLVAVGTPSAKNGSSDLSHLLRALGQLADVLKGVRKFQVVNVRSTVPPGTMRGSVIPLLEERSGRQVGTELGVGMNPEFLREGTSVRDYDSAPFDLCGVSDPRSAEVLKSLYAGN